MAAKMKPKIVAFSIPTRLMAYSWIVLLLPKFVKLAIIVTYMPANFDSVKSLHSMLLRKNWAFESMDRTMMKMYRAGAEFMEARKRNIIRASLMRPIDWVRLWIFYLADQCLRRTDVRKNTGMTRKLDKVVRASLEITLLFISSTVKLDEK